MTVTFWPSSRRLAIRPPHESATSSGCGATKTWVMAGRVYRGRPGGRDAGGPGHRRVAAGADERDEHAGAIGHVGPLVPVAGHHGQHLAVARPDRDDQAGAVGQLVAQGGRDDRRRRCDQDPVPRRAIGPAEAAVGRARPRSRRRTRGGQPRPGRRGEVRVALDRRHAAAEGGEDRRLVAGAGADLEDTVPGSRRQQLGHAGDHERLADGLAELDRERLVVVGAAAGRRQPRTARVGPRPSPGGPARHGCRAGEAGRATIRARARRTRSSVVASACGPSMPRGYARGARLRTGWARRSVRPTARRTGLARPRDWPMPTRTGRPTARPSPMRSGTPTSWAMPTSWGSR